MQPQGCQLRWTQNDRSCWDARRRLSSQLYLCDSSTRSARTGNKSENQHFVQLCGFELLGIPMQQACFRGTTSVICLQQAYQKVSFNVIIKTQICSSFQETLFVYLVLVIVIDTMHTTSPYYSRDRQPFANCAPTSRFQISQRANNTRTFIQAKVNIPSVWIIIITKSTCKTWSFCVPLEIDWRAKCGTRAVGCRPRYYSTRHR